MSPAFPTNVCGLALDTDPISINGRKSRKSCPAISVQDSLGSESGWLAMGRPGRPTWERRK